MTNDELLTLRRAFTKYCDYPGHDSKYVQIELADFPAFISYMRDIYPNHLFWEYGYKATFCEDTVTIEWRDFVPSEISDEEFKYMMACSFSHDLANESGTEPKELINLVQSIKDFDTVDDFINAVKKIINIDMFGLRRLLGDAVYNNDKCYRVFRLKYRNEYNATSNDLEKLKISFKILKEN